MAQVLISAEALHPDCSGIFSTVSPASKVYFQMGGVLGLIYVVIAVFLVIAALLNVCACCSTIAMYRARVSASRTCLTCALMIYTLSYSNQVDLFVKVLVCQQAGSVTIFSPMSVNASVPNATLLIDTSTPCMSVTYGTSTAMLVLVLAAVDCRGAPGSRLLHLRRSRRRIMSDPVFYTRSIVRVVLKSYRWARVNLRCAGELHVLL
jgi:hypothetical protein